MRSICLLLLVVMALLVADCAGIRFRRRGGRRGGGGGQGGRGGRGGGRWGGRIPGILPGIGSAAQRAAYCGLTTTNPKDYAICMLDNRREIVDESEAERFTEEEHAVRDLMVAADFQD